MPNIAEIVKTLGALAGVAALVWRFVDEFGSYLRISVSVDGPQGDWFTVLTTIDNKGNRPKDLANAFLLIGPEAESPIQTALYVIRSAGRVEMLAFTNDLAEIFLPSTTYSNGRAIIPLTFYCFENTRIGDETLTYRAPLSAVDLLPGPYAVRFFVFPKNRLHRSTQDCFVNAARPDPALHLTGPGESSAGG